jgi:hypothetical protein
VLKKGNLLPDTVKSYLGILENLENLFGGPDRNQEELKKFLLKGVERGRAGTGLKKRTVPVTIEQFTKACRRKGGKNE